MQRLYPCCAGVKNCRGKKSFAPPLRLIMMEKSIAPTPVSKIVGAKVLSPLRFA